MELKQASRAWVSIGFGALEFGNSHSRRSLFGSIKKEAILVLERLQKVGPQCSLFICSMIEFLILLSPPARRVSLYLETGLSALGFGFIGLFEDLSADESLGIKRTFRNALRDPSYRAGRRAWSDLAFLVRGPGYRSVVVSSKKHQNKGELCICKPTTTI